MTLFLKFELHEFECGYNVETNVMYFAMMNSADSSIFRLHTSTLFLAYFPFNTPFLVAAEQRSRSFFFKDDAYDISRITFAIK